LPEAASSSVERLGWQCSSNALYCAHDGRYQFSEDVIALSLPERFPGVTSDAIKHSVPSWVWPKYGYAHRKADTG
jgi:hypothetical protein